MTKQLRKQFILVNMLLVGTVLLVVFAALYKPLKKYFTAEDLKLAQ